MRISSSLRKACSAVTIIPARQTTPLEDPRGLAWTATVCAAARAVASASAFDSSMSASDIPHLHEQDATCAGRITSAVRLGGTRSFEQVRCDALGLVGHG